jgi:hypothetical protein
MSVCAESVSERGTVPIFHGNGIGHSFLRVEYGNRLRKMRTVPDAFLGLPLVDSPDEQVPP